MDHGLEKQLSEQYQDGGLQKQQLESLNVVFGRLAELLAQKSGALHHLNDEQRKANKVFDSIGAGMAVRGFDQRLPPCQISKDDLLDTPVDAIRAHVYSTTGFASVVIQPKSQSVKIERRIAAGRIGRVEFYNATDELIEITSGELPNDQRPLAVQP